MWQWLKFWSTSKSETWSKCSIWQIVKNFLVFCRTSVSGWTWLLESCAESSFGHMSAGLFGKIYTPGLICHELCVGSGQIDSTTPSGTWYLPSPNSFRWEIVSFMPRIWFMIWFYVQLSDICSRRSFGEAPEIKNICKSGVFSHWCEDRANRVYHAARVTWGTWQSKREWRKPETRSGPLPSTSSYLNVDVHAWGTPLRGYAALIERGRGGGNKVLCAKRHREAAWRWKPRGAVLDSKLEILLGVSRENM